MEFKIYNADLGRSNAETYQRNSRLSPFDLRLILAEDLGVSHYCPQGVVWNCISNFERVLSLESHRTNDSKVYYEKVRRWEGTTR